MASLNYEFRKLIKARGNILHYALPPTICSGWTPPIIVGEPSCRYTTGGALIKYPELYSKKGWSSICWAVGTHRILIGALWLAKHHPLLWSRVAALVLSGEHPPILSKQQYMREIPKLMAPDHPKKRKTKKVGK